MYYNLTYTCVGNLLSKQFNFPSNIFNAQFYELEIQQFIVSSNLAQAADAVVLVTDISQPFSYNSTNGSTSGIISYAFNDATEVGIGDPTTANAMYHHKSIVKQKTLVMASPGGAFTASLKRIDGADYNNVEAILRWSFTFTLKPVQKKEMYLSDLTH